MIYLPISKRKAPTKTAFGTSFVVYILELTVYALKTKYSKPKMSCVPKFILIKRRTESVVALINQTIVPRDSLLFVAKKTTLPYHLVSGLSVTTKLSFVNFISFKRYLSIVKNFQPGFRPKTGH